MKLYYQVNCELEIDEEDLMGASPEEFLTNSMEEDPEALLEASTLSKCKLIKAVRSEEEQAVVDADEDDDLTILDEDELDFEG